MKTAMTERERDANGAGDERQRGEPDEDAKERVNRELIELLNELRVALPGVQVLFAFLLIVPFSTGFAKLSDVQRDVYFVAFISTTIATVLLIAPSTYHRILFRVGDKERMLFTVSRFVISGTAFLAVAVSASVFVITDVLFHAWWAAAITAAVAVFAFVTWFGVPLYRRARASG
jgi:hypothetical protein